MVLALLYPNQVNNLTETLITPEDHSDFIKFGEFYLGCVLRESAINCQNLRESATILAEYPSYRSQSARINLASNSKSTLRGIEMTLATVAYRISTDVSFATLLQQNAEEALQQAGITLEKTEKKALETLLALPGQISRAGNVMLTAEPWVI
ncbi:MAG: hypothetical protein AB1649_20425 [Chloroflexota bacterium]